MIGVNRQEVSSTAATVISSSSLTASNGVKRDNSMDSSKENVCRNLFAQTPGSGISIITAKPALPPPFEEKM
ncbi:hypothetical protein Q0M94_22540 (plasmid) [Deinococcus radiomollis]|uniref:hypothetical protein n=1 Tax=Deinococcus radiomollis TaxID=468916 RepID=UPI0038914943